MRASGVVDTGCAVRARGVMVAEWSSASWSCGRSRVLGRPTADDVFGRRIAAAPPGYDTRRAPLEERQDRRELRELCAGWTGQVGWPRAGRAGRPPSHRLAASAQAVPCTGSVHTYRHRMRRPRHAGHAEPGPRAPERNGHERSAAERDSRAGRGWPG
ncbi:hypothetical protein FM103_04240 [Corynebacterium xerosis]|nr:hypothetical protein FM103_04240 [Corynebacterium xerosis]